MTDMAVLGCLMLAGLAVWISARFFRHPVSPFSLFFGSWFTALALYNLHWIEYVPIRRPAWILMGLGCLGFGLGWLLPYLFWNSRELRPPELVSRQVSPERLRTVIVICFVLGGIGVAAFLATVASTVGLATYIEAPGGVREAMAKGGSVVEPLKAFDWLNVANVVLCSFYLLVLKGRSRLVWPILAFSVFALFLMEDRTHFFYAFSWTGFLLLHSMKVTLRKVMMVMAAGAALLLAQFLLIAIWLGKVAENNPLLLEAANVQTGMVVLLSPYMYITESFPSLQVYMDTAPASTHGAMTFYPVFRMINMVDPTLEPPPIVGEFLNVPFESNTFTWLHQFYTDFGTAGVLVATWLVGLIVSFTYFRMLSTRSFYSVFVNGIFSYCCALSIFANHFTQGPAWFFLASGFLIAGWVSQPAASMRFAEEV
jgi:oligosaccharide repeat unit polymerase